MEQKILNKWKKLALGEKINYNGYGDFKRIEVLKMKNKSE